MKPNVHVNKHTRSRVPHGTAFANRFEKQSPRSRAKTIDDGVARVYEAWNDDEWALARWLKVKKGEVFYTIANMTFDEMDDLAKDNLTPSGKPAPTFGVYTDAKPRKKLQSKIQEVIG